MNDRHIEERALVFSAPLSHTIKRRTREEALMAEIGTAIHRRWIKALVAKNLCTDHEGDGSPEAYAAQIAKNYDSAVFAGKHE